MIWFGGILVYLTIEFIATFYSFHYINRSL